MVPYSWRKGGPLVVAGDTRAHLEIKFKLLNEHWHLISWGIRTRIDHK